MIQFNIHYIYPERDCLNLSNCLIRLDELQKKGQAIVKIIFFFKPAVEYELTKFSIVIQNNLNRLGLNNIPYTIVCQEPAEDFNFIVEILTINFTKASIEYFKYADVNYSKISIDSGFFLYAASTNYHLLHSNIDPSANDSFEIIKDILALNDMNFSNVIRQWNYIESILSENNEFQNYQLFNEVRNNYYKKCDFSQGYPAATGIGTSGGGVLIEIIAFKTFNNQDQIINLNNPLQKEAFSYSQSKLKKVNGLKVKCPPLFVRGKGLLIKEQASVFISGTASIMGENTVHINDFEMQTLTTLGLIKKLIDENIAIYGQVVFTSNYRIYLKNKDLINVAKSICEKVDNQASYTYLVADICRDNLLVEIEQFISYRINLQ